MNKMLLEAGAIVYAMHASLTCACMWAYARVGMHVRLGVQS